MSRHLDLNPQAISNGLQNRRCTAVFADDESERRDEEQDYRIVLPKIEWIGTGSGNIRAVEPNFAQIWFRTSLP